MLVLVLVIATRLEAQWHVTPFVGYAQHSPVGRGWGVSPDWSHQMVGVHFATPVLECRGVSLSYAPNAAFMRLIQREYGWTVAVAAAPFGLQLNTRNLYAQTAVGGLWSPNRIPTYNSSQANVTVEWGGGVEIRRLQLGYKFYHMSNAGTRPSNPGIDAHLFYAGWRVH